MSDPHCSESEFFIGYCQTPIRLRRMLCAIVASLILLTVVASVVVAINMRDPGDGIWALGNEQRIEGTFVASPYPMLELPGGEMVLIVNQGKVGASAAAGWNGKHVRVQGVFLMRLDQRMLELADVAEPIVILDEIVRADVLRPTPVENEQVFTGEIVDPKCFLGAMKPGDGKPHKACATLCLRGGIPPMFRYRDNGRERIALLTGAGLSPITGQNLQLMLPFVADDVEIHGTLRNLGTLRVIELVPGSVHRR